MGLKGSRCVSSCICQARVIPHNPGQHCNYYSQTNRNTNSAVIFTQKFSFVPVVSQPICCPPQILPFLFWPQQKLLFSPAVGRCVGPPGAPLSHQLMSFSTLLLRRGRHFISPNDGGCNEGCRVGKMQNLKSRLLCR